MTCRDPDTGEFVGAEPGPQRGPSSPARIAAQTQAIKREMDQMIADWIEADRTMRAFFGIDDRRTEGGRDK